MRSTITLNTHSYMYVTKIALKYIISSEKVLGCVGFPF